MSNKSINASWCEAFVRAAVSAGIRLVAICPGTRSASLVAELAKRPEISPVVFTDERAGAFFALGATLATGLPALVVTTSGSAVANATPALAEAYARGAPLILVSCDRPLASRSMGRPQTMDQVGLCRSLVFATLDLPEPTRASEALEAVAEDVGRIIERAKLLRLPAHINVPLLGNRTSTDSELPNDGVEDTVTLSHAVSIADEPLSTIRELRQRIAANRLGRRGLVIVGPDRHGVAIEEIATFTTTSGLPLICDTPARCSSMAETLIASADLLLALPKFRTHQPDLLIRFGSAPVSNDLQTYIGQFNGPCIHVSDGKFLRDYLSPQAWRIHNPDTAFMQSLPSVIEAATQDWLDTWLTANRRASSCFSQAVSRAGWSELQAIDCLLRTSDVNFISVANSLSVRLVNLLSVDHVPGRMTYVNRGLSGIDGSLSTFFGTLTARKGVGAAIIGDLALLHDLTSLEFLRHASPDCIIVVLNNDGAGLFDLLPLQTVPDYDRLIRNSIEYDIPSIAKAFAVRCVVSSSLTDLESALDTYNGGPLLIEVKFGREAIRRGLKRFTQSMMVNLGRAMRW